MTGRRCYAALFIFLFGISGTASAEMQLPAQDAAAIRSLFKAVGDATLDLPSGAPFSLQDALSESYRRNPEIQAARAALRAVDEAHTQAAAGFRPSVTGEADYEARRENGDITDSVVNQKNLSLSLTQPLYSGGSTSADIRAADSKIKEQRALLRAAEQQVMLRTATAYMDVVRDQEISLLTINNETALAEQLRGTQERFRLGDITLTDVQQSENRLADAIAARLGAQASLHKSKAGFESLVWISPANVEAPEVTAAAPATLEEALAEAEKNNPDNDFSTHAIDEAEAATRSLIGNKLLQLDLSGQLSRTYGPIDFPDDKLDTNSIVLRLTLPFYSGGRTDSLIRQSRETESRRRIEKYKTRRSVRQSVIEAWESLQAARAQALTRKLQIDAARAARDGVKSEADNGARSTLDVLDAEREYLNAQVNYAGVEHDRTVALYQLLAAMGDLTPENLQIKAQPYDAVAHYDKVKNAWFGTHVDEFH